MDYRYVAPQRELAEVAATPSGHRGTYDTVETAAARLNLQPNALRARCRRAQRLERGAIVAPLGGGIVAFKFGATWRVQFPASSR